MLSSTSGLRLGRIDGDNPRYVEALDVDVQLRQRVDESAARYSFVMKFFFTSPPIVERYHLMPQGKVVQEIRYQQVLNFAGKRHGFAPQSEGIGYARHLLVEILFHRSHREDVA